MLRLLHNDGNAITEVSRTPIFGSTKVLLEFSEDGKYLAIYIKNLH